MSVVPHQIATPPAAEQQHATGKWSIRNLRWWIAGLLALATALNYLDRQSFPVVVGEIKKEIPISDQEYARLGSLFLLAYAIMYAGGGRLLDVLGTRIGYAVMIVWWSAANCLTGTVSSVFGLGIFRFLLGLGEGGGFPGSGKAVAEWFPRNVRAGRTYARCAGDANRLCCDERLVGVRDVSHGNSFIVVRAGHFSVPAWAGGGRRVSRVRQSGGGMVSAERTRGGVWDFQRWI